MGLKNSEHIGMIKVDPRNSNVVYAAAYGPLWKEGGERGLYKTEDAGKTWVRILHISENTGCNEVHFDPKNPDIVYAAFHQRRRHEWTYLGGGPESSLHKSTDGGKTWKKLTSGLPDGDVGRITICIPPAKPEVIYAMIEAQQGKSGVYVSHNRGESWVKTNDASTAGNYYQEIMADPVDPNRFFIMDTWLKWSKDGGLTVTNVGEKWKHVDNHAIWINPDNNRHWRVGCDGGLYETWDEGKNWRHLDHLNITQFYRVSVDNDMPFYNIYGGTQDNNTLGGPARNTSANGISNSDWFVTVGGDGFKSQIDPTDPNIVYSQWQYGGLIRFDRRTGEQIDIKPIPGTKEAGLRWNWDAPLLISHHNPATLYFAANKIFKSTDRGNSWTAISPDLSRGTDRNKLPVMGRVWSMDAVAKNQSTSIYGNIMFLSESPKDSNMLIAGTDDGLIQITTDGGRTWNKISSIPGIPSNTLVSCVLASGFDKNTIYACFDNHRNGDFRPYIVKSTDGGKTWKSIASNLPANGSVKTLAEDFINPDLLFTGTEFGFFVTPSGGKKWTAWTAGLSPIAIKDIAIQKRECDLVLATFGRGFVVLDNYAALRQITGDNLNKDAFVFAVKPAKIFMQRTPLGGRDKGSKGSAYFNAPNPYNGAVIRYHLRNDYPTLKEKRQQMETSMQKQGKNTYYPSADTMRLEATEEAAFILAVITDQKGREVRRLKGPAKKGMQTLNWDLRYASTNPLTFKAPDLDNPYAEPDFGPFVGPGTYNVKLLLVKNNEVSSIGNTETITVDYLIQPKLLSLPADERHQVIERIAETRRNVNAASEYLSEIGKSVLVAKKAIFTAGLDPEIMKSVASIQSELEALKTELYGDGLLASREFETAPGIQDKIETAVYGMSFNTNGPTRTHVAAFEQAASEFRIWLDRLKKADQKYNELLKELDKNKVPYTPGRKFFMD